MAAVRKVAFNQGKNIKSGVLHKSHIAMKKLRQVYAEKRWILINEQAKTEAVLLSDISQFVIIICNECDEVLQRRISVKLS